MLKYHIRFAFTSFLWSRAYRLLLWPFFLICFLLLLCDCLLFLFCGFLYEAESTTCCLVAHSLTLSIHSFTGTGEIRELPHLSRSSHLKRQFNLDRITGTGTLQRRRINSKHGHRQSISDNRNPQQQLDTPWAHTLTLREHIHHHPNPRRSTHTHSQPRNSPLTHGAFRILLHRQQQHNKWSTFRSHPNREGTSTRQGVAEHRLRS